MVQVVEQQGSIFGRLGKGLGQALSEQVPKEVERYRLSQGLKKLGEKQNLSPFQRYSELLSIPGMTPQGIQTGGEILNQEARSKAFLDQSKNMNRPQPPKQFLEPNKSKEQKTPGSDIPSLTNESIFEKAQEGYIPPTQDQIFNEARVVYDQNPGFFNNDPNQAIAHIENKYAQEEKIASANQTKHQNLDSIQKNVVDRLGKHAAKLGADRIPAKTYSNIEDEAIQATKPKNQGGGGLTEQQAMKEYGIKLDNVAKQYQDLESVGGIGILGKKSADSLRNFKSLQKEFSKRGDTEQMADFMVGNNNISYPIAYAIAEPISQTPELNKSISKLDPIESKPTWKNGYFEPAKYTSEYVNNETNEISKKIFPSLGKTGSPLAVAYELEKLGYNPDIWMDYVSENQNKLGPDQLKQLSKTKSLLGTLNDWWLSSWTGLDKMEKK